LSASVVFYFIKNQNRTANIHRRNTGLVEVNRSEEELFSQWNKVGGQD
jgi:hypothetical protein